MRQTTVRFPPRAPRTLPIGTQERGSRIMRRLRYGFTLVELMIVVVILGILAAIAIPLYMKFVQQSKTGEAQGNLGKIATLVEEYYGKTASQAASSAITPGVSRILVAKFPNTVRTSASSCDGSPGLNPESVPDGIAFIQKRSYQPAINEWRSSGVASGTAGAPGLVADTAWAQMHFELSTPIRYLYCYAASTPDTGTQTFKVVASGDVDGDAVWSRFERRGQVGGDGAIQIGPMAVTNEDE